MIIDTSNAPCGPGFLPGLRLSEGRFAINRKPPRFRGWGSRRRSSAFVPLSADFGIARCGASRARRPVRPHLPPRRRASPTSLSPSFPCPPGPGRGALPHVGLAHESGAAAGGHLVSALTALRVRRRLRARGGSALAGGLSGGVAGSASGWPGTGLPRAAPPRRGTHLHPEPVSLLLLSRSHACLSFRLRPQIRRDNPLNLSILLSGGKETNQDSLSSGERRGKSPAPNPRPTGGRGKCGVRKTACPVSLGGLSPSDRGSARGRCEAGNGPRRAGVRSSRSRVVWECSPKRVVNSI